MKDIIIDEGLGSGMTGSDSAVGGLGSGISPARNLTEVSLAATLSPGDIAVVTVGASMLGVIVILVIIAA